MSKRQLLIHIILVIVLSLVVVHIVSLDICPSASDYISGVGSVASVYAILITLWQISQVKRIADETAKAVKGKKEEINHLLSYADVERHVEICNSISPYLKGLQYEAAAIKMAELKNILLDIKNNNSISGTNDYQIQKMVRIIGTDIVAMKSKWTKNEEIEENAILDHINDVSTFLQDISTKLKNKAL